MRSLQGHVALVTGASSGVGAATARLLASLGCRVLVNYARNADGAAAVVNDCVGLGAAAWAAQGDVADDADCRRLVETAVSQWGRLDILINNAGTTKFCDANDLDGLSAADFQSLYGVNLIGPFQMVRAARPWLAQSPGGGVIVNVASTAGITGMGSSIAYAASKGALVTLTLSLARTLGPEIRVNAVCPGFIQGDWLLRGLGQERYDAYQRQSEALAPLGVTATPETVADAILQFVIGSQIVTGETLIVDGGRHLGQTPLTRR